MATLLGKRKRRAAEPLEQRQESDSGGSDSGELDPQEVFRRHFEAQFQPLEVAPKRSTELDKQPEDEPEDESDWDGISDEGDSMVQVVEHTGSESRAALMTKEEIKVFMSSKIPRSQPPVSPIRDNVGGSIDDDDPSEAANLKKDLALQRLLAESHLLDSSESPTLSGNNRHKATDLRLQALGSKTSILKQEKMPMSHRKGITAKQNDKEEKRRREAKENGIILEKVKMGIKKGNDGKRDRGVGAPSVGRFSGGILKLSKKDIFDIEGPKRVVSGRGGRGGGRPRGKRGR